MKKRFLPFSLLLVIMILGQSVMAGQMGHYVPRAKETTTAEAFIGSMRVNQHTGLIDPAWMLEAKKQAATTNRSYADQVYWLSMGPDNMGGRTTSIVYNKSNMNEVYIGSMGGGVYYTWNLGISWHQVGEDLMVSCLAQAEDGTIYVGTGDKGYAASYNSLDELGYDNSFIGSGLWTIKNNTMNFVESTAPTADNGWGYINDIAIVGNNVIVATEGGLKYSADRVSWTTVLDGIADEVKVASDNTIIASVDGKLYIGSLDNMVCYSADEDDLANGKIATASAILDVAVAPNNANMIYAAAIGTDGNHESIYVTENKGQTWRLILPAVDNGAYGHQVYEGRGLENHGLVVDPANNDHIFVLGYNLWRLDRPTSDPNGYYISIKQSDGNDTPWFDTSKRYLHTGVNAMAFDPRNPSCAYIGTDGGIYKSEGITNSMYLTFIDCNRGYVTTRCMSVDPSNVGNRVFGGLLDHGPVLVEQEGDRYKGNPLLPYNVNAYFGIFEEGYRSGYVAASSINPSAFIMSTKSGNIKRTQTVGMDYDNNPNHFLANVAGSDVANNTETFNYSGFRMPIALWESFNDPYNLDTVWFKCTKDQYAGDTVQCFSNNDRYPFDFVLPYDLHYNAASPDDSDSIPVHDLVAAKLYVAYTDILYYTKDPLKFDIAPKWYKIGTSANGFSGTPVCLTVSDDGDVLYAGFNDGSLVRVSNLNAAVDEATSTISSADFAPVLTTITLPVTGQCVTSVSILPDNANKVVVTLGNYGNSNYVLYSNNALSADPTFTVKQGNLPAMPVYSSVFTSTYDGSGNGHVILGTEHGIYRTTDITAANPEWVAEGTNMGDVPVMALEQQTLFHEVSMVPAFADTLIIYVPREGVSNEGVIYAATYGKGLYRCETYAQHNGLSVPETTVVAQKEATMYPNPVRDNAKVSFELKSEANVTYQVFDLSGRMVKSEFLGHFGEGTHEADVNVNGLSNGSYILRVNAGSYTSSVKFMVF